MVVLTCSRAKSAKGRGILNILGNKRLYTWATRTKIYFRRRKKKIGNTNWVHTKGNKIYFGVQDYHLVLFCKVQPCHALLGYPFHNTAAHMEATPTREGI